MFEPRGTRNGQKFNFGEAEVESFLQNRPPTSIHSGSVMGSLYRPESLRRPKRLSSPAPDLIPERAGTYPRQISRRSLPPPPPPPRTSSLYSLSPHASGLSTRSPSTSSVASFTSILAVRPASESSSNLYSRPSVLSPIDVDCEVFSPAVDEGEPPIR